MKTRSNQERIIISGALSNLNDAINTLTFFAIDDEKMDMETASLLRICRNQILRDVNALNEIFNPIKAECE